jgi:hypothetical protein
VSLVGERSDGGDLTDLGRDVDESRPCAAARAAVLDGVTPLRDLMGMRNQPIAIYENQAGLYAATLFGAPVEPPRSSTRMSRRCSSAIALNASDVTCSVGNASTCRVLR